MLYAVHSDGWMRYIVQPMSGLCGLTCDMSGARRQDAQGPE